jgi:hypothetical protein
MAKTISNAELVATIKEQGFATEKQILLLKNRMNKSKENEKEISNLIADILPIKLTNVQMVKGVLWLYGKNIKKNGEFRKNSSLGYRELHILNNAKEAYLSYFYPNGNRFFTYYTPVWSIDTNEEHFEYMVDGGETKILG